MQPRSQSIESRIQERFGRAAAAYAVSPVHRGGGRGSLRQTFPRATWQATRVGSLRRARRPDSSGSAGGSMSWFTRASANSAAPNRRHHDGAAHTDRLPDPPVARGERGEGGDGATIVEL